MQKPKVIVIVGPTASGKTTLSITLAERFSGEIISADSRQVYRGLDLGTGKVSHEEMRGIQHHLLDVADPDCVYTVADFVRDGRKKIDEIVQRGHVPIIVGGTFFYIDALLGKTTTPTVSPDPILRTQLEQESIETLFTILRECDPRRAQGIDPHNKRRLIRAIEIVKTLGTVPYAHSFPLYTTCTLGIVIPKDVLTQNIHNRLISRLDAGMIAEVEKLHKNGLSYERMEELGLEYRYIARYMQGFFSYEEMILAIEVKSRQYAKRQMTWLKRDEDIVWISYDREELYVDTISDFLFTK